MRLDKSIRIPPKLLEEEEEEEGNSSYVKKKIDGSKRLRKCDIQGLLDESQSDDVKDVPGDLQHAVDPKLFCFWAEKEERNENHFQCWKWFCSVGK